VSAAARLPEMLVESENIVDGVDADGDIGGNDGHNDDDSTGKKE